MGHGIAINVAWLVAIERRLNIDDFTVGDLTLLVRRTLLDLIDC